jgi:hypothetical protein
MVLRPKEVNVVKIAFALVAHGNPALVERLVRTLISEGHLVAVHYDLKSPQTDYEHLVQSFAGCESVRFANRARVGWGQWSIIAATLNCLDEIETAGWNPDYVYYASGMDYPVRSSAELVAFLTRHQGMEFIQSVPADQVHWVKTGPQQERYQYRWHFNWREQHRRCQFSFALQQKFGLKRKFVRGMTPYIGSQWWVLSWETLKNVMALGRQKDIQRFFRTTLVPDELFFQTLVRHLVPEARIVSRTLTLYQFTDYGYPLVYYADHLDYLLRQPFFLARKLSPHSADLRDGLDAAWHGERKARSFHDDDIGIVGPEYEARRLTYRGGVPGRPVAGAVPDARLGDLERVKNPCFVVIGTSTAELRVVHQALSQHPNLLCHGQLFHHRRIEFAQDRESFAGYTADAIALREVSRPNFIADIVRAENHRLSGFLLTPDQGQDIAEVLMERPNIRVVIVRGDPMVAFTEHLLGRPPLLERRAGAAGLETIAPDVLADRFWRFVSDFRQQTEVLADAAGRAGGGKPKGWVRGVDLSTARLAAWSRQYCEMPTFRGRTLAAATGWVSTLEQCLGVDLEEVVQGVAATRMLAELARLEELRRLVIGRLTAGGIAEIELGQPTPAAAEAEIAGVSRWVDERQLALAD